MVERWPAGGRLGLGVDAARDANFMAAGARRRMVDFMIEAGVAHTAPMEDRTMHGVAVVVFLVLSLTGPALAVQDPTSNKHGAALGKGQGDGAVEPRTGGETIETATVILGLPYTDTGATCDYVHDYTDCVLNAGAPDVVYAYAATRSEVVNVSLCGSGYDTALWVYEGGPSVTIGCNDDSCGLQSEINHILLTPGLTYYIVISGYSTACGSYTLNVTPLTFDCFCLPGMPPEGEPPCEEDYVDNYNGGCNGSGWTVITGDAEGSAEICGLSGTYLYQGQSYRDTDWYDITGNGEVVRFQCRAEFPLRTFFIYGTDCQNLQYDTAAASVCQTAELQRYLGAGVHAWLWVGPSVFSGIPCGTGPSNEYVMHVTGLEPGGEATGACCDPGTGDCIMTTQENCPPEHHWLGPESECMPSNPCPPVSVEETTWGRIKEGQR